MSHLEFPDTRSSLLPILPRQFCLLGDSTDPRFLCFIHSLLYDPLMSSKLLLGRSVVVMQETYNKLSSWRPPKALECQWHPGTNLAASFLPVPNNLQLPLQYTSSASPNCPQAGRPHSVGAAGEAGTGSIDSSLQSLPLRECTARGTRV